MVTTVSAVEVEDLVKRYPKSQRDAVDKVSFTVRRGEIFGLLGPNGAGKTTTIGILTTSILLSGGRVRIMGLDVASDALSVKQHIGIVPQRSNLDQSLRVKEILTYHAAYHGVARAEREAQADSLLKEFGLKDRANEYIKRYSGGMSQRVMLARALMHAPDVLFLDEPTNNLDPQSRLFLWERIRALHAQGVTIVLTTHDMEEADQLCERIAIMDSGHILVLDTPQALKRLIPGGTTLDLRIHLSSFVEAHTSASHETTNNSQSDLIRRLSQLPGVLQVEELKQSQNEPTDVQTLRLHTEQADTLVVQAIQEISNSGARLQNLLISHPSLEDVFIHLTGRNLRS